MASFNWHSNSWLSNNSIRNSRHPTSILARNQITVLPGEAHTFGQRSQEVHSRTHLGGHRQRLWDLLPARGSRRPPRPLPSSSTTHLGQYQPRRSQHPRRNGARGEDPELVRVAHRPCWGCFPNSSSGAPTTKPYPHTCVLWWRHWQKKKKRPKGQGVWRCWGGRDHPPIIIIIIIIFYFFF